MKWGRDKAIVLTQNWHRGPMAEPTDAAFSFIELLVVVALVLLLTTLYWSHGSGKRAHGLQTACRENLRRIHMALSIYANECAGRFPVVPAARSSDQALGLLVPRYTVETSLFVCPAAKSVPPPGASVLGARLSYAYYMGRRATEPEALLMTDEQAQPGGGGSVPFSTSGKGRGSNHGDAGGNLLFADGHVQWLSAPRPLPANHTSGAVFLNPKP